jgi:hypothetical protein
MIWNYYHFYKYNITLNLQGINTLFKKSYLFKIDKQKNVSYTRTTISIYYKKLQKIVPKFIHMKKLFLRKRTCNPFLK